MTDSDDITDRLAAEEVEEVAAEFAELAEEEEGVSGLAFIALAEGETIDATPGFEWLIRRFIESLPDDALDELDRHVTGRRRGRDYKIDDDEELY